MFFARQIDFPKSSTVLRQDAPTKSFSPLTVLINKPSLKSFARTRPATAATENGVLKLEC